MVGLTNRYTCTICIVVPTQVEKMHAELASLTPCAVPFLSRAAVNLCWYDYTMYIYACVRDVFD